MIDEDVAIFSLKTPGQMIKVARQEIDDVWSLVQLDSEILERGVQEDVRKRERAKFNINK